MAAEPIGSPYIYKPLPNPSEQIRLLSFLPDERGEELRCVLSVFDLKAAPEYAAISDTWGEASSLRRIWIDGAPLSVRQNCWVSLRQVRQHVKAFSNFKHHERRPPTHLGLADGMGIFGVVHSQMNFFWIDWICINQDDLLEKEHQVQFMSDIFSKAACVLACFGEHHCDSKFLCETLRSIDNDDLLLFSDGLVIERRNCHAPNTAINSLIYLKEEQIHKRVVAALRAFAQSPYWHRLWIIPETQKAKSLCFLLGDDIFHLNSLDILRRNNHDCIDDEICDTPMYRVLRKDYRGLLSLPSWCLLDLIREASQTLCADPRDRIYAFLSFIDWKENETPIKPDYRKSAMDIFFDLSRSDRKLVVDKYEGARTIAKALELDANCSSIIKLVSERQSRNPLHAYLQRTRPTKFLELNLSSYAILVDPYLRSDPDVLARFSVDDQLLLWSDSTKYISPEARHGDLLFKTNLASGCGLEGSLCLVLRHQSRMLHQIIGQGLVNNTVSFRSRPSAKVTILFHWYDFLTFAAQDIGQEYHAFSASNRPNTRICGFRYSSYAYITFEEESETDDTWSETG